MVVTPPRAGQMRHTFQVYDRPKKYGTQGQPSSRQRAIGRIRGSYRQVSTREFEQFRAKWPTTSGIIETRSLCTGLHAGQHLVHRGIRYDVLGIDDVELMGRKFRIFVAELGVRRTCRSTPGESSPAGDCT